VAEIVSEITDWEDDFSGADTNLPQGPDDPGSTGQDTSLGAFLREMKSVIRRLSVDMAFGDPMVATRISDTEIQVPSADLRATVGNGQLLVVQLAASEVYAYANTVAFSSPNSQITLLFPTAVVDASIESVRFSQFQPKTDEFQRYNSTDPRIPAPYPFHGGWVQAQVGAIGVANSYIVVDLPWVMPSTNYRAFLTAFYDTGVTAGTAICQTRAVTKTTTRVTFQLVEAIAGGTVPYYEVFVWLD
jgi:hypothetical protein